MVNKHFTEKSGRGDTKAVQTLDATIVGNDSRAEYIADCIARGECYVVRSGGNIAGFAILEHKFFGNAFISLVMVHPEARRQGIATALIKHCQQVALTEKLFSSTNQSNKPMQQLFDNIGFIKSGCVDNLDENDPELFYFGCKDGAEPANSLRKTKMRMASDMEIASFREEDIPEIVAAFRRLGWSKPAELYRGYLAEQQCNQRLVWIVRVDGVFAGYVTLCRHSHYPPFLSAGIPEIKDLNVLPQYRNNGIAMRLMDEAENAARAYSDTVGIGVGMYPDYGAAQRLYVKRGYVPDGRGLCYDYRQLQPGEPTINDDNLVLMLTKKL
ncbi:MAG: GNAT family N-acetyltransferase [Bacillota bacterium]